MLRRLRGEGRGERDTVRRAALGVGEGGRQDVGPRQVEKGEPRALAPPGVPKRREREVVEPARVRHEALEGARLGRDARGKARGALRRVGRPAFPRERSPGAGSEEEMVSEDRPAALLGGVRRPPVHREGRNSRRGSRPPRAPARAGRSP